MLPTSKYCMTFAAECQIYIRYIWNTFVCTESKVLMLLHRPVYQSLCLVSAQKKQLKFNFTSKCTAIIILYDYSREKIVKYNGFFMQKVQEGVP